MVKLVSRTPAAGLCPVAIGACEITELSPGPMWSIAPFKGQFDAVNSALGLPKVQRSVARDRVEVAWFSQGQVLLIGAQPPDTLTGKAAISDQSDAWCVLQLKGATSEDVLARLVPVDLRQSTFKRGHCLRSQLGHMPLHITRTGNDAFRLMSFRSMAGTMVHELTRAMELLAARG